MPHKQRSNPKTKHQAIKLRKESTPAERKLWSRIRNDQLGVTFRRQHAVGNYTSTSSVQAFLTFPGTDRQDGVLT